MLDQILEWVVIALPFLFAVSVELIDEQKRKRSRKWRYGVFAFGLIISALTAIQINRADKNHSAELDTQQKREERSMSELKASVQASEIRNASDMGYLKGRLEAALSHPAPRFDTKGFAAALSEGIKAEMRGMSNKDLADSALAFCQELHTLSADKKSQYEQRSQQERAELRSLGDSPDPQQMNSVWQKWRAAEDQSRQTWEYEFRTKYQSRAVYFRDLLLSRFGMSAGPPYSENQLAFRGILAGASPVEDMTNYLESLAHQLLEKRP